MLQLIMKREITNFLGGKGTRISTIVMCALFLISGGVGGYFLRKNNVDTTLPIPENGFGVTLETNPFGSALGMITMGMMIFTVVMGVQMINQGVVEEKQSRVVEILLTTVKPRTLLLGKILGIGAGVLAVFAAYFVSIVGAFIIAGIMPTVGQLATLGVWTFLPTMLIWITLAYFTAAAISGAMASMASRQEDLQSASMLLVFGTLIPFYVAMYLVPNAPNSIWTEVLTYVPFFSPYIVTMRVALGQIGWLQQGIAIVITLAAIALLARVAGKIYERSVLHTGSPLKIRQVLGKNAR